MITHVLMSSGHNEGLFLPRYYISLQMDVAQDLIYITLCLSILSINDSTFKLIMPIGSSILLKNHVSCNFMLKYLITVLFR